MATFEATVWVGLALGSSVGMFEIQTGVSGGCLVAATIQDAGDMS